METILFLLPTIFSFLTGTLIAGSAFNVVQTLQTMYLVCRLRKKRKLLNRIRKHDVMQLCGGIIVTWLLYFLLFHPTKIVADHMQLIILTEVAYGLFLFSVVERTLACCHLIHNKTILH